jgi:hypothetical protein
MRLKRILPAIVFAATVSSSALAQDSERGTLASLLMSDEMAKDTGIDVRGWLSQGFTWNPDIPNDGYNGPVSFNDQSNEYQMNQLYGIVERKIERSADNFDLGGRADVLFGTDAVYNFSTGFDDDITSDKASKYYKMAIPQAYVETNLPIGDGVTVKAGHFYTLIGYEVVTAPDNFFYSHSYSMQYGEPFTHWGALASYQITEDVGFTGGVVRGWDNFTDKGNGNASLMGGLTVTISDDTSAVFSLITGNEGGQSSNRTMYSLVVTHKIDDETSYVFQHDHGIQEEGSSSGGTGAWYSVNNYLIHQWADNISTAIRLEWFRDEDGTRVGGVRSGSAFAKANYYGISLGGNIRPVCEWNNFMLRPEVRFDIQDRSSAYYTSAFDSGGENFQSLIAMDAILKF